MNYTRYVLDLEGHGRVFKVELLNFGVSTEYIQTSITCSSYLDFVYNECASQILTVFEPDIEKFLIKLTHLPDMKFFENIPVLQRPDVQPMFCNKFREFGFNLATIIARRIGLFMDAQYLLETIADDYIIIGVSKQIP